MPTGHTPNAARHSHGTPYKAPRECLAAPLLLRAGMGSFDSGNAPLREAFPPLSMTGVTIRRIRSVPTECPTAWPALFAFGFQYRIHIHLTARNRNLSFPGLEAGLLYGYLVLACGYSDGGGGVADEAAVDFDVGGVGGGGDLQFRLSSGNSCRCQNLRRCRGWLELCNIQLHIAVHVSRDFGPLGDANVLAMHEEEK